MWIQVMCFSAQTQALICALELPWAQLPERFEPGLCMTLNEERWFVIEAKPERSADVMHAGEVRLTLSKHPPGPSSTLAPSHAPSRAPSPVISAASAPGLVPSPQEALHDAAPPASAEARAAAPSRQQHDEQTGAQGRYSLATLCAKLPALDARQPCTDHTLLIHEDDWRQAEFCAPHLRHELLQEIADIERLFAQGMIGARIHLRDRVAAPMMPMELSVQTLLGLYTGARRYDGVGFRGKPHRVEGGFALTTRRGTTIYGVAFEGLVEILCLHAYDPQLKENPDFERLLGLFPAETIFVPWLLIGWSMP